MRIVFRYLAIQDVVDFALQTLRDQSPIGSTGDKHPGLYRDSHLVFLNGQVVGDGDVSAWRRGDQINISNPVPYSRKIEAGPRQAERARSRLRGRRADRRGTVRQPAAVKFTFMPVRFGGVQAYASFSRRLRPGRKLSDKARQDWLVRQPALEIKGR